jgi:hypothetical protein
MSKFKLRAQTLTQVSCNGAKETYVAVVDLRDLVDANNKLGRELYTVNVRSKLFSGKRPDRKNKVYSGIEDTLINIYNDNSLAGDFLNNNNGCLLICDSISTLSPNKYEIEINKDCHGIGNGQQTVSVASFVNNKYPIPNGVYVLIKIMVGYDTNECFTACEANNNSNKVTKKDLISNDWTLLSDELFDMGYTLHYKRDAVVPKGDNVINIYETGFYNILNSYHTEKPWITGNEVTNILDINTLTTDVILDVFDIKRRIDNWFKMNLYKYDDSKFDSKRTGYIKNIMVTSYKKYYTLEISRLISIDEFFTTSFDTIFNEIQSEKKKVDSSYFTKQTNCEILIKLIRLSILDIETNERKLKYHTLIK